MLCLFKVNSSVGMSLDNYMWRVFNLSHKKKALGRTVNMTKWDQNIIKSIFYSLINENIGFIAVIIHLKLLNYISWLYLEFIIHTVQYVYIIPTTSLYNTWHWTSDVIWGYKSLLSKSKLCLWYSLRVSCRHVWSRLSSSVSVWQQGVVWPCEWSLYLPGGMDWDLLWEA